MYLGKSLLFTVHSKSLLFTVYPKSFIVYLILSKSLLSIYTVFLYLSFFLRVSCWKFNFLAGVIPEGSISNPVPLSRDICIISIYPNGPWIVEPYLKGLGVINQ